jgi:hypothetical protein
MFVWLAETPVAYGCTVAIQHVDGRFLTLKIPTGELTLETPPDSRWADRRVMPFKENKLSRYQFTVRETCCVCDPAVRSGNGIG